MVFSLFTSIKNYKHANKMGNKNTQQDKLKLRGASSASKPSLGQSNGKNESFTKFLFKKIEKRNAAFQYRLQCNMYESVKIKDQKSSCKIHPN